MTPAQGCRQPPQLTVVTFAAERGFAGSLGGEYPDIGIHTTGYYWISDGTVYHLPEHSATASSPNALNLQSNRLQDGCTVRMVKYLY